MFGAFGNPALSNTPVDDIYSSQADTYGNSFSNPVNPANMNPGWGINPNLLTPSYMSNYRPQYSGPQPANEFGRVGMLRGLYNLSPFSPDPKWGNPLMHQRQSLEDVSSRPFDSAMWAAQRIAMPIAAYGVGNAITKSLNLGWGAGSKFGSGVGRGLASGLGVRLPEGVNYGTVSSGIRGGFAPVSEAFSGIKTAYQTEGLGAAFNAFKTGASAIPEAMSTMGSTLRGLGFKGAVNLASSGIMGAGFGVAASIGVPLAIGQGLMEVAEQGVIQPYINTRKSARDLRSNFSGITFNDSEGNVVSGRGLSFKESYRMGREITNQGISDMTFSQGQYTQGADFMARSGLLDNVNSGGLTKRIKENMEQVKLIMSIAAMPEMKDAMEQLAKFQQMGASTQGGLSSVAAGTVSKLGMYASMAGTSVQHLMNTVGAQGQYLYQANGMTPYLGQLAAAGVHASLATGQRMGLLNTDQIARMGGIEGGTQASLTGQINASQTLFNKMAMYNTYLAGRGGASGNTSDMTTTGVTTTFAQEAAKDPMGVYGAMMLHSGQMAGKQLNDIGSLVTQNQVRAMAKNFPGVIDKTTGKISGEHAVPFLMQLGYNTDQIHAFYGQLTAEQDPEVHESKMRSIDAQLAEQNRQYTANIGGYGGVLGGAIYNFRKGWKRGMKQLSTDSDNLTTKPLGVAADALQSFSDYINFTPTLQRERAERVSGLDQLDNSSGKVTLFANTDTDFNEEYSSNFLDKFSPGGKSKSRGHREVQRSINELANGNKKSSKLAREYLAETDPKAKQDKLAKLLKSGDIKNGSDYDDITKFIALNSELAKAKTITKNIDGSMATISSTEFIDRISKSSGVKTNTGNQFDNLQTAGLALELATDGTIDASNVTDKLATDPRLKKYSKATGVTDPIKLMELYQNSAINSGENGLVSIAESALQSTSLTSAISKNGGRVIGEKRTNIHDLSREEALGSLQEEMRAAKMRNSESESIDKVKSGVYDLSDYRKTIVDLNDKMPKAITQFEGAVNTFVKSVENSDSKKDFKLFPSLVDTWDKHSNNKVGQP